MATRVQRGTQGIKEEKDQIWLVLTVDMRKKILSVKSKPKESAQTRLK
jgi:hypothetical protein